MFRVHLMIQRCQHHVVADEAPFSDGDAALVLEVTAGIDKHIILHHDVLSKIRVKGREQGKGPINRLPGNLGKQFLNLAQVMAGAQFVGQFHHLKRCCAHKAMCLRSTHYPLSGVHAVQKFP